MLSLVLLILALQLIQLAMAYRVLRLDGAARVRVDLIEERVANIERRFALTRRA
jgi:hypothetical protein